MPARINQVELASIRNRCNQAIWGWSLYDIAYGPDKASGEARGRARGIVAVTLQPVSLRWAGSRKVLSQLVDWR